MLFFFGGGGGDLLCADLFISILFTSTKRLMYFYLPLIVKYLCVYNLEFSYKLFILKIVAHLTFNSVYEKVTVIYEKSFKIGFL